MALSFCLNNLVYRKSFLNNFLQTELYLAPETRGLIISSLYHGTGSSVFSISLNNTVIVPETKTQKSKHHYFCLSFIYYIKLDQSMKNTNPKCICQHFLRFFPLIFLYFVSKTSHLYAHNNALLMNLFPSISFSNLE